MSIIDSNARWEDEDKAMQEYLDQMDAEMAEVYDAEDTTLTPEQEAVWETDMHLEALRMELENLEAQDEDDWEAYEDIYGMTYQEALDGTRKGIEAAQARHDKAMEAYKRSDQSAMERMRQQEHALEVAQLKDHMLEFLRNWDYTMTTFTDIARDAYSQSGRHG